MRPAARSKLRLLFLGAHPDDCEFQGGATAAKFAALGHEVSLVSATNGDTGHQSQAKAALAARRKAESRKSCALIGARSRVLGISSNQLEADLATRRRFISLIRRMQPDLLFTHRIHDYHPDHRRTGILVQDSSYAIRVPKVCPQVPALSRVPLILYFEDAFKKPLPFQPDLVLDMDAWVETKARMLDCHVSQVYEWLPWIDGEGAEVPVAAGDRLAWLKRRTAQRMAATARRFRRQLIQRYGARGRRIRHAEAFELSEYGARPGRDALRDYFPDI